MCIVVLMMEFILYQEVALKKDLAEYNLKAGDIATLIDFIPHPNGGEMGCVLEIFNAVGESLTVVTVPISAVGALRDDEVLSVRSVAEYAPLDKNLETHVHSI